jgi:RNA 2',3'-cyclic 3'-phosphodiesterase
VRTFIALNLPQDVRDELHASLEPLRRGPLPVRWVAADALHLTLKFLGDIEGAEVPRIDDALRATAARHPGQTLEIGGFGAFPSRRRANVLWIAVTPNPRLAALQRDTELAFSRLGYAREQRPFRPHITVGRTQSGSRPPDVERLAASVDYGGRASIGSIDLMRSHLGSGGARHEVLLRIPLAGQPEP